MIFLVEYERARGRLVKLTEFLDSDLAKAEASRLALEIDLSRQRIDREVVLLQAKNRDALRRTHQRYFDTASDIVRSTRRDLQL